MGRTGSTKYPVQWHTPKVRRALCWFLCVLWLAWGGVMPAAAASLRPDVTEQAAQPVRLIIPVLGVDAPIEAVGQDDSQMAAPSSVTTVAWYNRGPIPGEPGNAVMAGHLDDVRGRAAVFWRLDELAPGDEIIVRFNDQRERRFVVTGTESYRADAAPLERIFGADFMRDLNLITCDGVWDAQNELYERRLVVFTRRIHERVVDATPQASPTPAFPTAPPAGSSDARQDRQQSLAPR